MLNDADRWDAIHKKIHQEGVPHSKYAEEKEKHFPRDSLVVDLGGGTGEDAVYFLQKGHRVVVFDVSEFALERAVAKARKYGFKDEIVTRQVDFGLHQLPLENDSVDIFYSRISLNYFPSDRTSVIFHDIHRALKPGGKAYLSFRSPEDEVEMEMLEKTCTKYEENVYIHGKQIRSRFTIEQLENMLKSVGIEKYKVRPYKEPIPHEEGKTAYLYTNEIVIEK